MKNFGRERSESLQCIYVRLQRAGPYPAVHLSREAEHMVIDALACALHNNGYALEGNTAEADEAWFAAQLWAARYAETTGMFERLGEDAKAEWITIAKAAIGAGTIPSRRISARTTGNSEVTGPEVLVQVGFGEIGIR